MNTSNPLDTAPPASNEGLSPAPADGLIPSSSPPLGEAQPVPDEKSPEISRDSIHKYVWCRYVDYEPAPFILDEKRALACLARHYEEHPLEQDAECFYLGILAYEYSFSAPPELRSSYLKQALEAFTAYRDQTTDPIWEPVADRLEDVQQLLASSP